MFYAVFVRERVVRVGWAQKNLGCRAECSSRVPGSFSLSTCLRRSQLGRWRGMVSVESDACSVCPSRIVKPAPAHLKLRAVDKLRQEIKRAPHQKQARKSMPEPPSKSVFEAFLRETEHVDNQTIQASFAALQGHPITPPTRFPPDRALLQRHRKAWEL